MRVHKSHFIRKFKCTGKMPDDNKKPIHPSLGNLMKPASNTFHTFHVELASSGIIVLLENWPPDDVPNSYSNSVYNIGGP